MNLNRRDLLLSGLSAGALVSGGAAFAQSGKTTLESLNEEQLGLLLEAMGLQPKKTEKRYDFAFRTALDGDEWNFTMSSRPFQRRSFHLGDGLARPVASLGSRCAANRIVAIAGGKRSPR